MLLLLGVSVLFAVGVGGVDNASAANASVILLWSVFSGLIDG